MKNKVALITGINGQTGSFLAEHLISLKYDVHGITRRTSKPLHENIEHIKNKITLHPADMTDAGSLHNAIEKSKPDEIYNLAGMSQVRWSYDVPSMTMDVNCNGLLRIIESVRSLKYDCKILQACSSEMFGKVQEIPQTETTPFYPRSPYGVSKAAAYYMARVYRESYNMKIYCSFCFNHECISANNPLILRENGFIKIMRPIDLRKPRIKGANIQQWAFDSLEIWDGSNFVPFKAMTATKVKTDNYDFKCRTTNTRQGIIETTNHHKLLKNNEEKIRTDLTDIGDELLHGNFPDNKAKTILTNEEAEFMGLMVSEGWISRDGKEARFNNNDPELLSRASFLWNSISMGYSGDVYIAKSGFNNLESTSISLYGNSGYLKLLRNHLYSFDAYKKVPDIILNAKQEQMLSFLHGYNLGDGLKKNPCTYKYKSFGSDSSLLAQGLLYLVQRTTKQTFNITFDYDEKYYGYYKINFHTPKHNKKEIIESCLSDGMSYREIAKNNNICRGTISKYKKGIDIYPDSYLKKNSIEIKKMIYHREQPEWVFDIETGSGKFMCGVGAIVIANSPRRGEEFLSRKVAIAVARIQAGLQDKLVLGNLDAKRDFGYAKEYSEWIHAIMQYPIPDDFIIATGETHSVKEFIEEAFKVAGIYDWENYLEYDKSLTRPAEVDLLIGDYRKSENLLGFSPKIKFKELVRIMVEAEIEKLNPKE